MAGKGCEPEPEPGLEPGFEPGFGPGRMQVQCDCGLF